VGSKRRRELLGDGLGEHDLGQFPPERDEYKHYEQKRHHDYDSIKTDDKASFTGVFLYLAAGLAL